LAKSPIMNSIFPPHSIYMMPVWFFFGNGVFFVLYKVKHVILSCINRKGC
jgi:hypothetical protein